MKNIITFLCVLIVVAIAAALIRILKSNIENRRYANGKMGEVYAQKFHTIVSIVGPMAPLSLLARQISDFYKTNELQYSERVTMCLSILLLIGSICFLLTNLNTHVWYDEEKFTKRNFVGKKSTIYYKDITKFVYSNSSFYVYSNGKRYAVSPAFVGHKEFVQKLRAKTEQDVGLV